MPDLMSIMINASKIAPVFIIVIQGIAIFVGAILVGQSLIDFYLVSNDNSSKMFSPASKSTTVGATVKLFVGGLFVGLGTLQFVGILSRTLTGDYVNSRLMSYSSSGTSMAEQAQLAVYGLLSIMQAVGICAVFKSLWALVQRHNGNPQGNGYGTITAWFLGGVCAWNFKWSADLINNTIGFDIISKLTPFS